MGCQLHDKCFKQEREAAIIASPRYIYEFDTTVLASDAWNPGYEEGLVLEEVEVSPSLFCRIVDGTAFAAARRTGEATPSFEV